MSKTESQFWYNQKSTVNLETPYRDILGRTIFTDDHCLVETKNVFNKRVLRVFKVIEARDPSLSTRFLLYDGIDYFKEKNDHKLLFIPPFIYPFLDVQMRGYPKNTVLAEYFWKTALLGIEKLDEFTNQFLFHSTQQPLNMKQHNEFKAKTYREHLERLPDGWREAALAEAEKQSWCGNSPDTQTDTAHRALIVSINFDKSQELYELWAPLYEALYYGKELPKYEAPKAKKQHFHQDLYPR